MQGRLLAGRYRLADAIGSGGMGRVWRAHDEVLHRTVAIKELTAALYVAESDRAVLLARTRGEARAAARINHSAVVTVHDVLEHDGRPWIVMELVEGRSLADAVKEDQRVEPREAARIGLWVLRALGAAHSAGVLHRDVKPGNVLLGRDGRVLLTDFGIAQIEGDSTITRTGEVVGSVDYLAPERVRGHDPGPASDLWALGATLYTAVEGRSPFRRTSALGTMQAVVEEEAEEPRYAGPLGPVITALLRKAPATRPSAAEAEQMLAEAAEGRRPSGAQAYVPTRRFPDGGYASGTADTPYEGYGGHEGHGGHERYGGRGTATPYPPVTGPAAAGPTTTTTPTGATIPGHPGTTGPAHPGVTTTTPGHPSTGAPARPGGPSRRRRLRTLAVVIAAAVVVGAGAAVLMRGTDLGGDTGKDTAATGSPTPDTSGSAPDPSGSGTTDDKATGSVPHGWVRYDDPLGFSLWLPEGWKRQPLDEDGDLRQIDYTPDGGEHFVRIAVDTAPDFNDPYAHQLDLEQQLKLVGYRRVTLERSTYRDRDSARWEFTWNALAKDTPFPGPRRAVEEAYLSRDGVEYILYMSSPQADWATTREQFTAVLQGWQERTG
ncbi:serine/threonine-protein kinase [Streptomyces sp. NPDC000134]|uniref:serine/threonine-protein kinase n=1 Tax=Streptomyces sp. NPDC000134 TaxID=3364536 RepID=UPI00369EBF83